MFKKTFKYAFILGHVPELSRQEIIRILEHWQIGFAEIFANKEVFIVEAAHELDSLALQERLGGVIKIAGILSQMSSDNLQESIEEIIKEQRTKNKEQSSLARQKFQFGFSLYGNVNIKEFQKIGLTIKRKLKTEVINSRFVVSKEKALSSVIVKKEKLVEQGADVVIIKNDEQYYLGHSLTVQDFEEYSARDYGRPNRDDKSGMLPPKLAKIMLNLAGADFADTILDPFCGSGTIIQEALIMGYKNIIGSDISEKAVQDSQNNINWLKMKYELDVSGVKIFQADVRSLSDKIKAESIDVIVTEPYLGPSSKKQIPSNKKVPNSKFQIPNIISELSQLYLQSFREFYKVLKKGGRIVMILPIINRQKMEILNQVKKIGFTIDELSGSERGSIIYGREGARVEREIFVFRK